MLRNMRDQIIKERNKGYFSYLKFYFKKINDNHD